MLNGKVALVTGASRGIGRTIAIELAKAGAKVAVNYSGSEQKANEVVDEIKALGQAIVDVMQESYQYQGATIHTYKTVYGEEGNYSTLFKVYGQKQDPLGNKIIKQQTPDKRTIHWCPDIQI